MLVFKKRHDSFWGLEHRLLLLLAAMACSGCAGMALQARIGEVGENIEKGKRAGAIECAPVPFALAQTHHEFALLEYGEGDYYRAKSELAMASKNAEEARRLSSRGDCVAKGYGALVDLDDHAEDSDGDGIANASDDCPDLPEDKDGYKDADGCPDEDNDLDGLSDSVDACPNKAEDVDGFEDADGCPDIDNDDDGLSDRLDQCPDDPEDDDGFEDDDGCPDCDNDQDGVPECPEQIDQCPDRAGASSPDGCPGEYKNVVVTNQKIEIRQTIFFETNRTTIKPISFALLNEVAQALKDNQGIAIRIEGHTDSRGRDKRNLKLSQGRAESVMAYLVAQGIDKARLRAKGYGENAPLADNRTRLGRQQNRRVEFMIQK